MENPARSRQPRCLSSIAGRWRSAFHPAVGFRRITLGSAASAKNTRTALATFRTVCGAMVVPSASSGAHGARPPSRGGRPRLRRWPDRRWFLLRALDAGLSLPSLRASADLSLRAGSGDEARPAFAALARLPEVQELLAPLPLVLRHAASGFVARALEVPENHLPTLHFREVRGHWADSSQAKMAFDVLRSTGSGLLSFPTLFHRPFVTAFHRA